MRENPYLIRMELPEDCIKVSNMGGIYYRMFHDPVTEYQKNELDCMHFQAGTDKKVGYHEHTSGTETFMISQGKFLCYCMGRGFYMEPGDLLHIQPWMGHSFTPVEPDSRLNIMFMGINQQYGITTPRTRLQKNFPGVFESEEFKKTFTPKNHGANARTFPADNIVEPEKVDQLRKAGRGIREYKFDGIEMHLKIAKYETEGVKEVWDLFLKKGFHAAWDNFLPEYRLFWVTAGKVKCFVKTSFEEEMEFIAEKDNIIDIPPYTPFRFEVIEDAQMYDLDCPARLEDLGEELTAWQAAHPGEKMDKEEMLKKFKDFDFSATDIGYNG